MTAHPVGIDQTGDVGLLVGPVRASDRRVVIDRPSGRRIRDRQGGEDLVVEAALTEQKGVDPGEELARLGTLDDPMVVGRRQA